MLFSYPSRLALTFEVQSFAWKKPCCQTSGLNLWECARSLKHAYLKTSITKWRVRFASLTARLKIEVYLSTCGVSQNLHTVTWSLTNWIRWRFGSDWLGWSKIHSLRMWITQGYGRASCPMVLGFSWWRHLCCCVLLRLESGVSMLRDSSWLRSEVICSLVIVTSLTYLHMTSRPSAAPVWHSDKISEKPPTQCHWTLQDQNL